jgi:hypothetical protein
MHRRKFEFHARVAFVCYGQFTTSRHQHYSDVLNSSRLIVTMSNRMPEEDSAIVSQHVPRILRMVYSRVSSLADSFFYMAL